MQRNEIQLTTAKNGANLLKQEHCRAGLYKPLAEQYRAKKGNDLPVSKCVCAGYAGTAHA